jgi:hypothetical protein
VLVTYLKQAVPFDDAAPGATIAVHTFGDFQQFIPHLHLIATDEYRLKFQNPEELLPRGFALTYEALEMRCNFLAPQTGGVRIGYIRISAIFRTNFDGFVKSAS